MLFLFFFKQKTAYEMRISDWSSDVCSSDLATDFRGDFRGMGLEREMPGLEEAHHRGGDVAPEGLGAGRQEEGIVPAPDREEGRLVGAEICLEDRQRVV